MLHVYLYENFELYNPFITVELLVWALFGGFVFAALLAVYNKRLIGGLVKRIISENATSPEKALTVTELGYGTDWFIKNALRKDAALLRFVARVDAPPAEAHDNGEEISSEVKSEAEAEVKSEAENKLIDFETARFYIPEELKYRAEVRYAGKGTDFVAFGICIVIFAVAAFAAIFLIPDLIQLIDNFIGTFK